MLPPSCRCPTRPPVLCQAPDGVAGHLPGGVAETDDAVVLAHQNAQFLAAAAAAVNIGPDDAHPLDAAGRAQLAEQSGGAGSAAAAGRADGEVGYSVAVALESGGVGGQRRPVGVARQVYIGPQFVAGAAVGGGAAHLPGGGGLAVGERRHIVGVGGVAVAVGVMADGVELGRGAEVNEAVVIVIVVDDGLRPGRRERQQQQQQRQRQGQQRPREQPGAAADYNGPRGHTLTSRRRRQWRIGLEGNLARSGGVFSTASGGRKPAQKPPSVEGAWGWRRYKAVGWS